MFAEMSPMLRSHRFNGMASRWGAVIEMGDPPTRTRASAAWSEEEKKQTEHSNRARSSRPHRPKQAGQDHYRVLGINSDATPRDIKLAFRQLARKYHPDVNNDFGAAEVFKTIRFAYEILSDKTSRHAYDHSLRMQAHAARKKVYKSYQYSSIHERRARGNCKQARVFYRKPIANEDIWEFSSSTWSVRQGYFGEYHSAFGKPTGRAGKDSGSKDVSDTWIKHRALFLRKGWENSTVEVLVIFCLVGFIWHAFGVQLALTYFVFFMPHNEEHTAWYRFASLVAWLIGGTRGLALQYGIVTTGWLYGKGYDMALAFVLSAIWLGSHLSHAFPVPRGVILLITYICLGGMVKS